jgi:hypothetical protein
MEASLSAASIALILPVNPAHFYRLATGNTYFRAYILYRTYFAAHKNEQPDSSGNTQRLVISFLLFIRKFVIAMKPDHGLRHWKC